MDMLVFCFFSHSFKFVCLVKIYLYSGFYVTSLSGDKKKLRDVGLAEEIALNLVCDRPTVDQVIPLTRYIKDN